MAKFKLTHCQRYMGPRDQLSWLSSVFQMIEIKDELCKFWFGRFAVSLVGLAKHTLVALVGAVGLFW